MTISTVDFGSAVLVVRRGPLATRFRLRTILVTAMVLVATAVGALVSLSLGDLPVSVPQVVAALTGRGEGFEATVILEWRLPRTLSAVVFGAALGVSGAVFQSLTRNPLASPDVIGVSVGAYTGGVLAILLVGGGFGPTATGALVGGVLSTTAVYLLAYRRGLQGFRLIVVGIGITAMLSALATYLLMRARLEVAMAAAVWGSGSLNSVTWAQLLPAIAVIVVAAIALAWLGPSMHQLALGDDAARALGVRVERSRLGLIAGAVVLTAVATAVTGPIAFVALAAPQIARRLTGSAGIALGPAAAVGALVLVASDLIAQHALPVPLPVGVVTVVIGGGYLLWLIVREARRSS